MIIKDSNDFKKLQYSGAVASEIRNQLQQHIQVGMSTYDIDQYAKQLFYKHNYISAPKVLYDFPGNICISVNSCVSHGVPKHKIILKDNDIINIDISGHIDGYYSDTGVSFVVGKSNRLKQKLVQCSKDMFYNSLEFMSDKCKFKQMGKSMDDTVNKYGYTTVKGLSGHGVGKVLHDIPKNIYPTYFPWDNRRFKANMVVAIETFVTTGDGQIYKDNFDNWSYKTIDGYPCAQYEHTIVITHQKPIILTE